MTENKYFYVCTSKNRQWIDSVKREARYHQFNGDCVGCELEEAYKEIDHIKQSMSNHLDLYDENMQHAQKEIAELKKVVDEKVAGITCCQGIVAYF